jgi:hypothetical protein
VSAPGTCWRELEVDGLRSNAPVAPGSAAAERFWSRLAVWIARRASSVRALRLHNLRHVLQPLEDAGRHAALARVWAALAPPHGLTALELSRSSIGLAPGTVASLACLTSLRSLALHSAGPLDCAELDSLADGLPGLEELGVCLLRRR